jgi:hypothetical protein
LADRAEGAAAGIAGAHFRHLTQVQEPEPICLLEENFKLSLVNHLGHIEERARQGGNWDPRFNCSLLLADAALVYGDPWPSSSSRRCDFNRSARRSSQPPERHSAAMAQQRSLATGRHRRHPSPPLPDVGAPHGVDASMQPVKLASFQPATDRADAEAGGKQLLAGYDSMLPGRKRSEFPLPPRRPPTCR